MATTFRLNKPAYYRVRDTEAGLTLTGYTLDPDILHWLDERSYRWRIWDQKFTNGDVNTYLGCYLAFEIKRQAIAFVLNWDVISDTFAQEQLL